MKTDDSILVERLSASASHPKAPQCTHSRPHHGFEPHRVGHAVSRVALAQSVAECDPRYEGAYMPILTCRKVKFYSQGDERAFFETIGRIKAIQRVEGRGDCIFLQVQKSISQDSLRDLIAVFLRYRISMRQLAQFLSPSNRRWFADPAQRYHKRVFPGAPKHSPLQQ